MFGSLGKLLHALGNFCEHCGNSKPHLQTSFFFAIEKQSARNSVRRLIRWALAGNRAAPTSEQSTPSPVFFACHRALAKCCGRSTVGLPLTFRTNSLWLSDDVRQFAAISGTGVGHAPAVISVAEHRVEPPESAGVSHGLRSGCGCSAGTSAKWTRRSPSAALSSFPRSEGSAGVSTGSAATSTDSICLS